MADYAYKSSRILEKAREFALAFFVPNGPKLDKYAEDDLPLHTAALCLYSATLLTQVHENLPQVHDYFSGRKSEGFNCDQRARQLRSKIYRENQNLSQQQIDQKTEEQLCSDVRNALAHGSFKISFNKNGKPIFVLSTTYKNEPSNMPVSISYEALFYTVLAKYESFSSQAPSKEDLYKQLDDFTVNPQLLKNYVLPDLLLHMATFFYNRNYNIPKEKEELIRNPVYFRCLQLILLNSLFAYNQNDAYLILSKDSDVFKKLSVIRNSLVHNLTELTSATGIEIKADKEKYKGLVRPQSELFILLMEAEMMLTKIDIAKTEKQIHFDSVPDEEKQAVKDILASSDITPENAEEKKTYFESVLKEQINTYNKYTMGKIVSAIKWFDEHNITEIMEEDDQTTSEKTDSNGDGK